MKKFIILPVLLISTLASANFAQNFDKNQTGQDTMSQHMQDNNINKGYGRHAGRSRSSRKNHSGSCCY